MRSNERKIAQIENLRNHGFELTLLDDRVFGIGNLEELEHALPEMTAAEAVRRCRGFEWGIILPDGIMAVRLYHHSWEHLDQEQLECGTHAAVFCRRHETWHTQTMFFRVPQGFIFPEPGLHPRNHFGAKISYYAPGTALKVPPSKGCKWVRPLPDDLTTLSELPRLFWPLDEPDPCN